MKSSRVTVLACPQWPQAAGQPEWPELTGETHGPLSDAATWGMAGATGPGASQPVQLVAQLRVPVRVDSDHRAPKAQAAGSLLRLGPPFKFVTDDDKLSPVRWATGGSKFRTAQCPQAGVGPGLSINLVRPLKTAH